MGKKIDFTEKLLEIMNDIFSESYTPQQKINIILINLNEILRTDVGIVSKIENEKYTVIASSGIYVPGDVFDLKDTYCSLINETRKMYHITDIGNSKCSLKKHPLYKKRKIETYIAYPIFIDGEFYGTLNFSGAIKREAFSKEEMKMIQSFMDSVGVLIKKVGNK